MSQLEAKESTVSAAQSTPELASTRAPTGSESRDPRSPHMPGAVVVLCALALFSGLAVVGARIPHILQKAFGGGGSGDAGDAVNAINGAVGTITSDALPIMIAVVPLAFVFGAFTILVGSRRGVVIIASAIGALLLLLSIKGISA